MAVFILTDKDFKFTIPNAGDGAMSCSHLANLFAYCSFRWREKHINAKWWIFRPIDTSYHDYTNDIQVWTKNDGYDPARLDIQKMNYLYTNERRHAVGSTFGGARPNAWPMTSINSTRMKINATARSTSRIGRPREYPHGRRPLIQHHRGMLCELVLVRLQWMCWTKPCHVQIWFLRWHQWFAGSSRLPERRYFCQKSSRLQVPKLFNVIGISAFLETQNLVLPATITGDLNLQYYRGNNLRHVSRRLYSGCWSEVWKTLWWLQLDQSYEATKHKDPSFYAAFHKEQWILVSKVQALVRFFVWQIEQCFSCLEVQSVKLKPQLLFLLRYTVPEGEHFKLQACILNPSWKCSFRGRQWTFVPS